MNINKINNEDDKRVLYLVTDSSTANIFGVSQIERLRSNGYKIYLVTSIGKLDEILKSNLEYIYQSPNLVRQISLFNDFKVLYKLLRIINSLKPSMIIYSTPKAAFLGAIASYILRIPIRIYQIWGARWQSKKGLTRWIIIFTDLLTIKMSSSSLAVSKSLAQLYSTITTAHIDVLDHASAKGIDNKIFFFDGRTTKIDSDSLNLGYLGRVANDKGIQDLVELIYRIQKKIPKVHLDIIGPLDESDSIPIGLQKQIRENTSIDWFDSVEPIEIPNIVRRWDLQVFLSRREGLGNSVIELGACGVPTIGWDIVGLKDAVPDELKYLLIPEGNMDLMESSVLSYFQKPLTIFEREKLSNWTLENFDSELVLTDFINYVNLRAEISYA
jgi:glycosyltransferase involved in cell wall biosynthesis